MCPVLAHVMLLALAMVLALAPLVDIPSWNPEVILCQLDEAGDLLLGEGAVCQVLIGTFYG